MPSAQFAKFDRQFKQASCQLDAVTYAILRIAGIRTRVYFFEHPNLGLDAEDFTEP